jgi:hypothetical protein
MLWPGKAEVVEQIASDRPVGAFLWHQEPCGRVERYACASEESKCGEPHPDDRRVHTEVLGDPGRGAGEHSTVSWPLDRPGGVEGDISRVRVHGLIMRGRGKEMNRDEPCSYPQRDPDARVGP